MHCASLLPFQGANASCDAAGKQAAVLSLCHRSCLSCLCCRRWPPSAVVIREPHSLPPRAHERFQSPGARKENVWRDRRGPRSALYPFSVAGCEDHGADADESEGKMCTRVCGCPVASFLSASSPVPLVRGRSRRTTHARRSEAAEERAPVDGSIMGDVLGTRENDVCLVLRPIALKVTFPFRPSGFPRRRCRRCGLHGSFSCLTSLIKLPVC